MDRIRARVTTLILLLAVSLNISAAEKKKVNILSWWGYLSANGIKQVEKNCNVELFVDEYYSSSEFLRRWDENRKTHSLIIYSNTIYNAVQEKLFDAKIPELISTPYHPLVTSTVKDLGFTKNTRLLTLAFTGFMWNKKNIDINEGLSLEKMLTQARDNLVVILDDPIEGFQVLNDLKYFQSTHVKSKAKAKVVIANDIENLVKQPNYAFSYHWLGGAIAAIINLAGDFELMVHPKLSHVTADLISIMNSNPESVCVYNQIAGTEFLKNLQQESFYFSPYGGVSNKDNKHLVKLYKNYFLKLDQYRWLKQTEMNNFKDVDDKWKRLKIQLSN